LENVVTKNRRPPTRWVYVYEIAPPDDDQLRRQIDELLDSANQAAQRLGTSWAGRLVVGSGRARILIVTDSPAQNRRVNRMIETGLRQLKVEFTVTVPLGVEDDITPIARRWRT
jgi:hypothetical protein